VPYPHVRDDLRDLHYAVHLIEGMNAYFGKLGLIRSSLELRHEPSKRWK
jgi:hypothetical protein